MLICFEPHPKNYELLAKNLGFQNVDLRKYGLAAECREQTLYLDAQTLETIHSLKRLWRVQLLDSMTVQTEATENIFNDIINTNKNKFVTSLTHKGSIKRSHAIYQLRSGTEWYVQPWSFGGFRITNTTKKNLSVF